MIANGYQCVMNGEVMLDDGLWERLLLILRSLSCSQATVNLLIERAHARDFALPDSSVSGLISSETR